MRNAASQESPGFKLDKCPAYNTLKTEYCFAAPVPVHYLCTDTVYRRLFNKCKTKLSVLRYKPQTALSLNKMSKVVSEEEVLRPEGVWAHLKFFGNLFQLHGAYKLNAASSAVSILIIFGTFSHAPVIFSTAKSMPFIFLPNVKYLRGLRVVWHLGKMADSKWHSAWKSLKERKSLIWMKMKGIRH